MKIKSASRRHPTPPDTRADLCFSLMLKIPFVANKPTCICDLRGDGNKGPTRCTCVCLFFTDVEDPMCCKQTDVHLDPARRQMQPPSFSTRFARASIWISTVFIWSRVWRSKSRSGLVSGRTKSQQQKTQSAGSWFFHRKWASCSGSLVNYNRSTRLGTPNLQL